jgi:hypothetical protein
MVALIVGVLAFLLGVYLAPQIRGDLVKVDEYIKGKVAADRAALKAAAEKQVKKL